MIQLSPNIVEFVEGRVHRFARCWRLSRLDGLILCFTEHNRSLTFTLPGEPLEFTYEPAGGMDVSAKQRKAQLEAHSSDVAGMLTSDKITDDDLAAGLYRGTNVEEILVDWEYPWAGPISIFESELTEFQYDGVLWNGTLVGVQSKIDPRVGNDWDPLCRYDLGDADCGVDLNPVTFLEALVAQDSDDRETIATTSITAAPFNVNDYFNWGTAIGCEGPNAGFERDIRYSTFTGGVNLTVVALQEPFPYDISVGDIFDLVAGCGKTLEDDCHLRYLNSAAFGGHPHQPGQDKARDIGGGLG